MGDDADDNSDDESAEDGEVVEATQPQSGVLLDGRFCIVLYYDLVNLYTLISHYIFPPF